MNIKNCFILGAGLGTRMGTIGNILPKVLWPIYEKSLLELQISFAKNWGCQNFFMNSYHLSHEVEEFVKEKRIDIRILKEDPLLDSGGAFFNLKKKIGGGIFLYLNSDVFYFFDHSFWSSMLERITHCPTVLAGLNVSKSEGYNQTIIDGELLRGISDEPKESDYVTYAGLGLVNLDLIGNIDGPVRFFESIADWRKHDIPVITPKENFEYWDFGTRKLYIESIYRLAEKRNGDLFNFLVKNQALEPEKLSSRSYRGNQGIFNFCGARVKNCFKGNCVIMKSPLGEFRGEGLYCSGQFDPM